MKIAFVCSTVFQIFNAVDYVYSNPDDRFDIFICDTFKKSKEVYNKIGQTNLFEKTYYIIINKKRNVIYKCYLLDHLDKISNFKGEIIYDEVIIGTLNNIAAALFFRHCVRNQKKFSIIDEGVGTYCIDDYSKRWHYKHIIKFLGLSVDMKKVSRIILYNPELYVGNAYEKIERMPDIPALDDGFVNDINTIFSYNGLYNQVMGKVIFMDQPLTQYNCEGIPLTTDEFYSQLFPRIAEIVGNENFVIKWHPRTKPSFGRKYTHYNSIEYFSGGWEVVLLNQKRTNNIYITTTSSAALLGPLLFHSDDTAFFLYKMCGYNDSALEAYINRVIQKGIHVIVPETMEIFLTELRKIWLHK